MATTSTDRIAQWRLAMLQPEATMDFDQVNCLERLILRTPPITANDAVSILDVLDANLAAGERTDGADHVAIRNLRRYVLASANVARPASSRPVETSTWAQA